MFCRLCVHGGPELLDGLQRLAIAVCEGLEDGSLFIGQCLADDGNQENTRGLPAIAGKQRSEVLQAFQSLAHGDELAHHSAGLGGCAKCLASGLALPRAIVTALA